MYFFKKSWTYLLISFVVLLFFSPVFKGSIPFPGDYLASENPYKTSSFLGYAPGGYPNKGQGIDVAKEIYPWRHFSLSELKSGNIPFWNPYNFSGNPQLANFQTAVFYPLNIFYFIFSLNISWTILIMVQPLLAAIFMYLFLNKSLKLSKESSTLGGVVFGFSSYMTVWLQYANIGNTFLWLPLILFFIKRLIEKITAFNFLGLCLSFIFCLLGGYIQGFSYIFIVSFLFLIFLSFTEKSVRKGKVIVLYFVSLLVSVLISSFQLLLTLQIFQQSTRGNYSLSQISDSLLPPYYLITFFFSDFFGNPATRNYWIDGTYIERVMYIGVTFAFFVFYAVRKIKSKELFFFLALTVLSLIIAVNFPLIKYLYLIPIPVISTTIPTRELSIFIFSGIVLAAMGINHWQKNQVKSKLPFYFIGFYLAVMLGEVVFSRLGIFSDTSFKIALRNSILPFALIIGTAFVFYLKKYLPKASFILLFLIVVLDLFYFFNKITPFSPQDLVYPDTPVVKYLRDNAGINRFWGYGSGYISSDYQAVDKTFSPEGNDPLHIVRYGELLASSIDGQIPEVLPRPDANIAPGFGKEDLKNNLFRKRILDLLGVKYVLNLTPLKNSDEETFPKEEYEFLWQEGEWQIYENRKALPRFFLVNDYVVEAKKEKILNLIYDPNFNLNKKLILEKEPGIQITREATGSVELVSYNPNKIEFKTNTDGNMLLFISDNFYPDWKALIDNKEGNLQRANYSFRAIPIPKGQHEIVLQYSPSLFWNGLKLAGFGILLVLLVALWLRINEKKN